MPPSARASRCLHSSRSSAAAPPCPHPHRHRTPLRPLQPLHPCLQRTSPPPHTGPAAVAARPRRGRLQRRRRTPAGRRSFQNLMAVAACLAWMAVALPPSSHPPTTTLHSPRRPNSRRTIPSPTRPRCSCPPPMHDGGSSGLASPPRSGRGAKPAGGARSGGGAGSPPPRQRPGPKRHASAATAAPAPEKLQLIALGG